MIHKLSVFLLVVGLALNTTVANAQQPTAPGVKPSEPSPELKQNTLKLLSAVARETQQFNLPENRVGTGTIVAGLMWEHDERAARAVYQSVFVELQNLFAEINRTNGEEMSETVKINHFYKRLKLADLRRDYVLTVARHDAQAALDALDALKADKVEGYDPLAATETEIEMELASAIAKKDPDKASAFARRQIAAKGITPSFIESVKDLHAKDSAVAARIGREILAEIKNAKIRSISTGGETSGETANVNSAQPSRQTEIEFWTIAAFINAASEVNRRATRDKEKKIQPLLADAEMRELTDLTARTFLSAPNPAQYSVSHIMGEISRYSPAQARLIRLKVGAKVAREFDRITESGDYQTTYKEKTADELAQIAARSAPDARDPRYADAARRAVEENEPEKARAIAERIKDRENYGYVFENIAAAIPLAKARRGDAAAVRQTLAALKTNNQRIAVLTELAFALVAKGDRETAKNLLDEARQMMPALVKTKLDLRSAANIANAYAVVSPDEAFAIVESGIARMNEHINAGILLNDFYEHGSIEADELFYDAVNRQGLLHVQNSTDLLKNLARADFERAVSLADKFQRPEIRLLVRLRIAQALLDAEAAEKEKKMREQVESEDREH